MQDAQRGEVPNAVSKVQKDIIASYHRAYDERVGRE